MIDRRTLLAGAAGALAASKARAATAWRPSKSIQIICGFAPGAATDLSARIVAEAMTARLGQSVIVENKTGAGSLIAIDYVYNARPDGYTLLQGTSGGVSVLPAVKRGVAFKTDRLSYIGRLIKEAQMIAINPQLPIKSVPEFVAYAKAHTLRAGTAGVGGVPDLTTLLLGHVIGADIIRVPYRGSAEELTAVLGGFIDMAILAPSSLVEMAKSGKVRVIASTAPTREPGWPDVRTLAESGFPKLTVENWFGLAGPPDMQANVLDTLRSTVAGCLADPAVQARLAKGNMEAAPLIGDDFKKLAIGEYQRWSQVAKDLNISIG